MRRILEATKNLHSVAFYFVNDFEVNLKESLLTLRADSLASLRELTIWTSGIDAPAFDLNVPHPQKLKKLVLDGYCAENVGYVDAVWSRYTNLEALTLKSSWDEEPTPDGLLTSPPKLDKLRVLEIEGPLAHDLPRLNKLLLRLPSLERLELVGSRYVRDTHPLTAQLLSSPLPGLTSLCLTNCTLTRNCLSAVNANRLPNLRSLELTMNRFPADDSAAPLLQLEPFTKLKRLKIEGSDLSASALGRMGSGEQSWMVG